MLIMENKRQDTTANYIPPNQVGPSNKPPDPGPFMQSQVYNQWQQHHVPLPNQPQSLQLSQNIQNNITSQPNLRSVSGPAHTPIPNVSQYSNIQNMFNASEEDGEKMNNAGDVRVCEASLSYLLRALCGIRHLEESTYNREYLLEMARKDKEELQKRLDDLGDAEQEIRDLRSEIERLKMAKSTDDKTRKKLEKVLEAEKKSLIEADKTIVDARTQVKVLESEAAVDFAAGFSDAIAQVQVLAPEVDSSEAHYTKEIRDGQLVIASNEEDSGKKHVDVQDDQIHAVMKSGVKPV
ncbi:mediator of RNA polymerase II transcription subunit 15a [Trifolium repens]|nr:mediator of RNA polymerase II transcription subunit 15a [Trifolium repens]